MKTTLVFVVIATIFVYVCADDTTTAAATTAAATTPSAPTTPAATPSTGAPPTTPAGSTPKVPSNPLEFMWGVGEKLIDDMKKASDGFWKGK